MSPPGLANGGRIPFVSAASCFLTGRALEQIKADVAYSDRNVKLCGMSPGMAYGELGPTHHSIEDIAWLRAIDNMIIVVPASPVETAAALRWAAATEGPAFIRVSRMAVPEIYDADYEFVPGRAHTVRDGDDVTIISNGTVLWRAIAAAEQLAGEGISARVISMPTVKPLDVDAVIAAARETQGIVTAEEATTAGGLGGAVAETVVQHHPTRMTILGVPEFAPTGSAGFLLDRYGMSPAGIADAARALVDRVDPMTTTAPDFRLDGRTALVTGAASGIGRGIALGIAGSGAAVACLDLPGPGLDAVVAEARRRPAVERSPCRPTSPIRTPWPRPSAGPRPSWVRCPWR